MRSRASNRKEMTPGGRGEDVEAHQGLEEVRNTAEEEIGRRGGAPAVSSGGGAVAVREERRGGARGGEEMVPPLYRAEREREGARLRRWAARSVAAINGGSVRWRFRCGGGGKGKRRCGSAAVP
jgi:hypothetical protein